MNLNLYKVIHILSIYLLLMLLFKKTFETVFVKFLVFFQLMQHATKKNHEYAKTMK